MFNFVSVTASLLAGYFAFCTITAAFKAGALQFTLYSINEDDDENINVSILLRCFVDCVLQQPIDFATIKQKLWLNTITKQGSYEQYISSSTAVSLISLDDNSLN